MFTTSSAANSILSEKKNLDRLSPATRAYFQNRTKNRLYDLVLGLYRREAEAGRLTQVQLARRMGKQPAVVNRLLGSPANWGLETLSDLLLAIAGEEIDATSTDPEKRAPKNSNSRAMLRDRWPSPEASPATSRAPRPKFEAYGEAKVLEHA